MSREVDDGTGNGAGGTSPPSIVPGSGVALAVLMFAMFVVIVDTTILNVALPAIARDLDAPDSVQWVVTAYFLAIAVAQTVTGWVSARLGLRTSLVVALTGFAVMAAIAASAPNLWLLVATRAVQGIFGGLVVPVATAVFFEIVPRHRRGTVVGISGTLVATGPAVAPLLGGFLVGSLGWRWLLFAGVPAGLLCAAATFRWVPAVGTRERRPFDFLGVLLGGGAASAALVGLSRGSAWGWSSASTIVVLLAVPVLGVAFATRLRRAEHPIVRPAIFAQVPFVASLGIVWAASVAQFGSVVFVPVQLQVLRGMSPFEAGALVSTVAFVAAASMPLAGRWSDRVGARLPATAGTVALIAGAARMGTLSLDTPVWQIAVALGALGLGRVLVTVPATVEGLNVISDRLPEPLLTEAASVRLLNRQVAGAVVTAGLAAVVIGQAGSLDPGTAGAAALEAGQSAYNQIFLIAGVTAATVPFLARFLLPSVSRRSPSELRPDVEELG